MRLDLDDDEFRGAAETWLRTLSEDVIVQFTAVVDASPGYYPTTLHTLWLAELARRGLSAQTVPGMATDRRLSPSRTLSTPIGDSRHIQRRGCSN